MLRPEPLSTEATATLCERGLGGSVARDRYQLLVCLRGPGFAAREQQVRRLLATTAIRG